MDSIKGGEFLRRRERDRSVLSRGLLSLFTSTSPSGWCTDRCTVTQQPCYSRSRIEAACRYRGETFKDSRKGVVFQLRVWARVYTNFTSKKEKGRDIMKCYTDCVTWTNSLERTGQRKMAIRFQRTAIF